MKMKIPFPFVPVGEWTVFRHFTAPGLFAYRHVQADNLLQFPDYAGGDLNAEQRREALDVAVNLYRPLTALVIFLNVVALEDFIRELSASLADIGALATYFPNIFKLKKEDPKLNFKEVNTLYYESVAVKPLPEEEFPRLYDLALVRHTVAHNGSIFRDSDVGRFQYYQVQPGRVINPPIAFVKETCHYLYETGRTFANSV